MKLLILGLALWGCGIFWSLDNEARKEMGKKGRKKKNKPRIYGRITPKPAMDPVEKREKLRSMMSEEEPVYNLEGKEWMS